MPDTCDKHVLKNGMTIERWIDRSSFLFSLDDIFLALAWTGGIVQRPYPGPGESLVFWMNYPINVGLAKAEYRRGYIIKNYWGSAQAADIGWNDGFSPIDMQLECSRRPGE